MELTPSIEQEALRDSVRKFLASASPMSTVREVMESSSGYDALLWKRMAEEMGLQGMAIPEEFGGSGYAFSEVAIVLEEMGRAVYPGPYLSSAVISAELILRSGDESAKNGLLPGIADGSRIVTLAELDTDDGAVPLDKGLAVVTGMAKLVLDGPIASTFLVVASGPDGSSIIAIDADAVGVSVTPRSTLDKTRRVADVVFSAAIGTVVGAEANTTELLDEVKAISLAALAAEQYGGAARALEITVEYVKIREQFGRKIGSFQAVKHRLADLLVEVESASSASLYATSAIDDGVDVLAAALVAGATCSEAYVNAAQETIQLHGGIGYTWEHDAHLYLRRAKSSAALFGAPHQHRATLADLLAF